MGYKLDDKLVIGISSRALFNLEAENQVYETQGLAKFSEYQLAHEGDVLPKGTAFPLVEALLSLNKKIADYRPVEVVIMSRNSPYTGMRLMQSLEAYDLAITRLALTGGESLASYLEAYSVDLFLSKDTNDVQKAVDAGFAAGIVYDQPEHPMVHEKDVVRFAFDADAVVFSDESELIYKEQGLEAFIQHEKENRDSPMNEGPFAKLIKMLSTIQEQFPLGEAPIRIGIVTARNAPSHLRVIKTLRAWGVFVDAAFFLGGVSKERVLEAFRPHIFFDDQDTHVGPASRIMPSSRVPYRSDSKLHQLKRENEGGKFKHE